MENMDDEQLNSLDQQKRSFIFGVILIAASLVLGKLLLIPLILFPGDKHWYVAMLVVYLFSWLMLIPGIVLAGIEGYRLVMSKYKDYQHKTVDQVKKHGLAVRDKLRRKNL